MELGQYHTMSWKQARQRAVLACLSLVLSVTIAKAQAPIGNLIGGLLNAAVIQAVQGEWDQLPPLHASCLRTELQKRGLTVPGLVQRGIGPFHASLVQIADPCVRAQEEADQALARQRKEEADRALEAKRQEQARLAQDKKQETDRIAALRKVVLRKNMRCDIVEQAMVYSSFCDENLYRKTDGALKNPLQSVDAINARLFLEDLILDQSETSDATARRKQMMAQVPSSSIVPGTRYECPKMKANRQSLVCSSYELALMDGLYFEYFRKASALDQKTPAIKKEFALSLDMQRCELDQLCLKKTYLEGIEAFQALLRDGKVTVPSYQEHVDQLRAADTQRAADLAQLVQQERAAREKGMQAQREQAEAKQREADRVRESERLRLIEEREAKERAEQEQKRLAEDKRRQEAEALAKLKQKWLQASQSLGQDKPQSMLQSCKSGALARKQLNEARDLSQRASVRQTMAQECSCLVTALLASEEPQARTFEALLAYYESGASQAGQDEALKSTQMQCQALLSKDILESWKAN